MTKTGTTILRCDKCRKRIFRTEDERAPSRCLKHLCGGKLTAIRPR